MSILPGKHIHYSVKGNCIHVYCNFFIPNNPKHPLFKSDVHKLRLKS